MYFNLSGISQSFVKLKCQQKLNLSGIKIKTICHSFQSIITNSFYHAVSFVYNGISWVIKAILLYNCIFQSRFHFYNLVFR